MEIVTHLGVGGIFAVLVIKLVLDHLEKKAKKADGLILECRAASGECQLLNKIDALLKVFETMASHTKDLHRWHEPDQDGEQAWKNKRMIELIDAQKSSLEVNTQVLRELATALQGLQQFLKANIRGKD